MQQTGSDPHRRTSKLPPGVLPTTTAVNPAHNREAPGESQPPLACRVVNATYHMLSWSPRHPLAQVLKRSQPGAETDCVKSALRLLRSAGPCFVLRVAKGMAGFRLSLHCGWTYYLVLYHDSTLLYATLLYYTISRYIVLGLGPVSCSLKVCSRKPMKLMIGGLQTSPQSDPKLVCSAQARNL